MSDMNLEPGCDTCEHIADVRGITLEKPNTRWFTQSAVDELTAGLRATLEARTAALTRTIERAETAEAALADLRAKVEALADLTEGPSREGTAKWSDHDRDIYSLAIEEARAALEGGR